MFSKESLEYTTWKSKYALPSETTPDQMHKRMAKEFARVERDYSDLENDALKDAELSEYGKNREFLTEESIYDLFRDFKYIVPQGSIMYGLGRKDKYISLSNCFVIPSALDSYGGILKTDQEQIQLMKRRRFCALL